MTKITIQQGTLKGGISKTDYGFEYYEFLGIPYAKPPIGDLRFKSPQAPEPWDGERDATSVSENQVAFSIDTFSGNEVGTEDCLYLNVFTPQLPNPQKTLLPVIVFFHGGGFFTGSSIIKRDTGPDFLIDKDVVMVAVNYRLGIFGFLNLGIPEAAGNMGLKDQIQALKWVQNNIEKFGGDKSNVTIHGISAGSASCEYLILSPSAKGLFHKAILQSGSSLNHWAIDYEPQKLVNKLLQNIDYKGSTEDNLAIYKFLLSAPTQMLGTAAIRLKEIYTTKRLCFAFVPSIEKDFGNGDAIITDYPYKLLQEGKFNHVPILRGFTNKEGYLTKVLKPSAELAFLKNRIFTDHFPYEFDLNDTEKYNTLLTSAYLEKVQADDDSDSVAVDFFGDLDFVAGVLSSSEIFVSRDVPLYLYQLCYDGKINMMKIKLGLQRKGNAHGDDTAYVLNTDVSHLADDRDAALRDKVTKMWTNFAKFGCPTPQNSDLPLQWPQFTQESKIYLNIDEEFTLESNYEPKKMAIFSEIYNKYKK